MATASAEVRAFADRLNRTLNTTVTHARLEIRALPDGTRFDIAHYRDGRVAPFELNGGEGQLRVLHQVQVDDDGLPHTHRYSYAFMTGPAADWAFRYEFNRVPPRPDYRYPLAHVHVAGDMGKLHFPTRRMPLELVLLHLLTEDVWPVAPLDQDWAQILEAGIADFEERRSDL